MIIEQSRLIDDGMLCHSKTTDTENRMLKIIIDDEKDELSSDSSDTAKGGN